MTEQVIPIVGSIFANRATDEAGRAVLVIVLLDRGHVGVLPDGLGAVHVSRLTLISVLLGLLLIHNRLLWWFLLLQMALLMIRKSKFGIESKKHDMEIS